MPRPPKTRNLRVTDLFALLIVAATGIMLIVLGVQVEALATATAALASLYTAWRGGPHDPGQDKS